MANKGKVLVMDDEEVVRNAVGSLLRSIGYEVACAQDGTEAIRMYQQAKATQRPFSIVIMDLTVPRGMGGKEAIQKLLEIDPAVKAIISSGCADDPVMVNFGQYGFSGAIAKPYNIQDLQRILKEVLAGRAHGPAA